MNIRHNLDPALVAAQITCRIKKLEATREEHAAKQAKLEKGYAVDPKGWRHKSTSPAHTTAMYDEWIKRERGYYATARVIQLPRPTKLNSFVLVYGEIGRAHV